MDELADNSCSICGYDASSYSRAQLIALVGDAARVSDAALDDHPARRLDQRPEPGTWSPLEYVDHLRAVFEHNQLICTQALDAPDTAFLGDFPPGLHDTPATLDRATLVGALEVEARRNADLFYRLRDEQWTTGAVVMEHRWTLRFALEHMAHELLHHSRDISIPLDSEPGRDRPAGDADASERPSSSA